MARIGMAAALLLLPVAALFWTASRECVNGYAWRGGWLPEYVDLCARSPATPE